MCVCVIDTVGEQAGQPPGDDVHHSCMSTARRTVCTDDDVVWSTARQPLSVWLTIIAPLSLLPSATRKCINVPFCFTRPESYFGTFSRHCTMVSSLCTIDIHTHPFNGHFLGLSRLAGTRKVKLIWILLEQETVSGSGISWAICKYAPLSRLITTPAALRSVFYRPDALPAGQPTVSEH